MNPPTKNKKNLEMIFAFISAALGVILFLIPKTPEVIVAGLILIFCFLIYPLWNSWWIEDSNYRRVSSGLLLAAILVWSGFALWPPNRDKIVRDLIIISVKNDWGLLEKKLKTIHDNPSFRDIDLFFTGVLLSNARPGPDPDRYLSQVPPESDLFPLAQRKRYENYCSNPTKQHALAIINTMERASLRNSIYYTLRLNIAPPLTHREILALYEEYIKRNKDIYDFNNMKYKIQGTVGLPFWADLYDIMDIPGCSLLFSLRILQTSHQECITDNVILTIAIYDNLVKNEGVNNLNKSLYRLWIKQSILNDIEQFRNKPLPDWCKNKKAVSN